MTPEDALKRTQGIEKALTDINTMEVVVGITKESATQAIYGDGGDDDPSVLDIGARHEYGYGVPQRSFLRASWINKADEINKIKKNTFLEMVDLTMSVEDGFEFLGVSLRNFSMEAFATGGFGQWRPLSAQTIAKKGNAKILVATNTLKGAMRYEIRKISNAA